MARKAGTKQSKEKPATVSEKLHPRQPQRLQWPEIEQLNLP